MTVPARVVAGKKPVHPRYGAPFFCSLRSDYHTFLSVGLRCQSERHPDSPPEEGLRVNRFSIFVYSGCVFWRLFLGGFSRGPRDGRNRLQERDSGGPCALRRGCIAFYSCCLFSPL